MLLLYGATGVFAELKSALNHIWDVPTKNGGGLWGVVLGRLIALVMVVDWFLANQPGYMKSLWRKRSFRWACLAGCFYGIVFFGVFDKVQFIYFQF